MGICLAKWERGQTLKPHPSSTLTQSAKSQQHTSLPQTTKSQQAIKLKPSTQQSQPTMQSTPEPQQFTFANVIADILSQQGQPISTFMPSYQIWVFLKKNNIKDYADLEQHLKNLMGQQRKLSQEFTPIRDKQKRLAGYINENDKYQKLKEQYKQYQQDHKAQKPWKKKSFEESNRWIVDNYNKTKDHMDSLRNDQGKIPLHSWQKEHAKLSAEIENLNERYQALKTQVNNTNKIRIKVYDILRKESQPAVARGVEGHTI